ncbi:MAG: apolipoprotein N-acyltransferase [Alphaproteobacteria bacterium]|nr:apolipoprotein N-acyltransferase [Alphaproteobacteria bacterium]
MISSPQARPAASLLRRAAPLVLAVLSGAGAALAQPPFGLLPGVIGYGVLFRVVDGARGPRALRSAALRAGLGGLGYFMVSLIWIYEPFQVDAADQGWMGPLAVPLMAALMALFWAAAGALYRRFAGAGVLRALWFAAALAAAEWARGHLLTGFPWDLPGETWPAGSALSQSAALVGAYGLTWLTLAAAAALSLEGQGRPGRRLALAAVAVFAGLWGIGAARIAKAPAIPLHAPRVRIVQADIPQASKYDPAMFDQILGRYVALTARSEAGPPPDVVVWPEGAVPAALGEYLVPGTWTQAAVANALLPRQTLIVGGYRFAPGPKGQTLAYNSLEALRRTPDGLDLEATYDKYRLVPFGEFMPLDSLAQRLGIKQFVHVGDGFAPGPPPTPRRLEGLPPVQPLICYEALYPGFTRAGARRVGWRPDWIVNISNDAWFGDGSGPRQHFNMARYRAIEEGLPVVRATPTGVSAIIDALGRVAPGESLGLGGYGVVEGRLPAALPPTLYDQIGDGGLALFLLLSLLGVRWPRSSRSPS